MMESYWFDMTAFISRFLHYYKILNNVTFPQLHMETPFCFFQIKSNKNTTEEKPTLQL